MTIPASKKQLVKTLSGNLLKNPVPPRAADAFSWKIKKDIYKVYTNTTTFV